MAPYGGVKGRGTWVAQEWWPVIHNGTEVVHGWSDDPMDDDRTVRLVIHEMVMGVTMARDPQGHVGVEEPHSETDNPWCYGGTKGVRSELDGFEVANNNSGPGDSLDLWNS